jgi:hypothetical protein
MDAFGDFDIEPEVGAFPRGGVVVLVEAAVGDIPLDAMTERRGVKRPGIVGSRVGGAVDRPGLDPIDELKPGSPSYGTGGDGCCAPGFCCSSE